MKLFAATVAASLLASVVLAVTVTYDTRYDQSSESLNAVACSNGVNGLEDKGFGFKTFGDLPGFPNIGGIPAITGWNSPSCGTCWNLTYMDNTIMVLGVDTGGSGFNIALGAMQSLTGGNAIDLGVVSATVAGPMPLASCNTTQGRKNGKPGE